jgi:tRNA threonylcarbamoyladenosine biosynthesis protein TsaE
MLSTRYTCRMHISTHSAEQTLQLGGLIGRLTPLPPALSCIALDGPLGAGKTHLVRGIAEGAEIEDAGLVSSPTYVLMNIYPGPKPIWHLDAYRISSEDDFAALGLDEIFSGAAGGGIVVIEWAARIATLLPTDQLHIAISHEGENRRDFQIAAHGQYSRHLLKHLQAEWNALAQQSQQQQ